MFRRNVSSKIPRNDAKEMAKKTNAWMKRDPDGEERKEKKGKKEKNWDPGAWLSSKDIPSRLRVTRREEKESAF